jgi:hypothetical protein
VLIGNFYEEAEHRLTTSQGEQLLGLGTRFAGEATTAATQQPEVRLRSLAGIKLQQQMSQQ